MAVGVGKSAPTGSIEGRFQVEENRVARDIVREPRNGAIAHCAADLARSAASGSEVIGGGVTEVQAGQAAIALLVPVDVSIEILGRGEWIGRVIGRRRLRDAAGGLV